MMTKASINRVVVTEDGPFRVGYPRFGRVPRRWGRVIRQLIPAAICILGALGPKVTEAHPKWSVCNKGDTDLKVVVVRDVSIFVWESTFKISGYHEIKRKECETFEFVEAYVGFAYEDANGDYGFKKMSWPRGLFSSGVNTTKKFCVHPTDPFERKGTLGALQNCPKEFVKVPFGLHADYSYDPSIAGHDTYDVTVSSKHAVDLITIPGKRSAQSSSPSTAKKRSGRSVRRAKKPPKPKAKVKAPRDRAILYAGARKRCDGRNGCDVVTTGSTNYFYRPFGREIWYDQDNRTVAESSWPKLAARIPSESPQAWAVELNRLLARQKCSRGQYPAFSITQSAERDDHLALAYTHSYREGSSYYRVDQFDPLSVNIKLYELSGYGSSEPDCWSIDFECATWGCGRQKVLVREKGFGSSGSVSWGLNGFKLYFSSTADGEEALGVLRSAFPHFKMVRAPRLRANVAFAFIIATLSLVLLAIPFVAYATWKPARVFPFTKPTRVKGFFVAIFYIFAAMIAFGLAGTLANPGDVDVSYGGYIVAGVGLVIGIFAVLLPIVVSRRSERMKADI